MKKTLFIALGMAGVLFLYGYFSSSAGHDHKAHGGKDDHHAQESSDTEKQNSHKEQVHSH
ncbi:hypothetical protein MNBD_UNCLBAC01-2148 [hydrothermal vent metagenome]|uniref:Uncharacterized protein n=1 Tax=hydrothermal vent metagenome TaxID=652676 RepID=A0A3B1E1G9_9ZZZZ